ncbi:transforming growth factor beta-1-induced transcript 1 protein isoform X4 [Buteo buteo]|uniref:transforming growth factor beta-1-induced transcript 1 protein isoform X4 n=1 Tax=Buteo buteo TaxID=30397 RepID=UPI003EB79226
MGCLGVFEVPRGCGAPHRGPTDTSRPTQERPTGAPLCGMRHRGGLQGAPWGAWGSSRCPIGVGCPTEVQRTPRDPHKNIPLAPHCWGHTVEVVFKVPRGVLGGLRGAPWVWGAPRRSNGHPATPTRTSHWRPVAWDAPSRWSSRCPVGCLGVFEVPHGCGVPHRGPTDTSQPTQERPTGAPLRGMSHRGGLRGAPWGAWGSSRCPMGVGCPTEVQQTPRDPHKNIPLAPRCVGCAIEVVFEVLRGVLGGLRGAPWVWGAPQRSNRHPATPTRTSHWHPVAWDAPSRWSSRCSVGCLGVFEVPRGCGVPHRGPTDTPRPPQEHPTGTPLRGMRHRGGLRGAPWGAWGSSKCPVGYLGVFEVPRGCGAPHGGPTDTPRPPQEHSTGEPLDGAHHRVGHEGFLGGLGGLHARDPRRGIV